MNNLIYYKGVNDFSRKYLIVGNEYNVDNTGRFIIDHDTTVNRLGELLLLHNGVALEVYGENIPLSILVNIFGLYGVEALLDQKAIEFSLDSIMLTYLVDNLPNVFPLQSGELNSKAHCDPEESATLGLKWLQEPIPKKSKKPLIKKAVEAYKIAPVSLAMEAAKFGHDGYESNTFEELGLKKEKDLDKLTLDERKKLCGLATESLELAKLALFHYNSIDSYEVAKLNKIELDRLKDGNIIEECTYRLFRIENVPDFASLLGNGSIKIQDIPNLRYKKNFRKFRKWINDLSIESEPERIGKEYIDAILKSSSITVKPTIKLFKTLSISLFSSITTTAIGGPIAGAIGAGLGRLADISSDVTINLLDTYILDGFLKGWNPRHFFDKEIRPVIGERE